MPQTTTLNPALTTRIMKVVSKPAENADAPTPSDVITNQVLSRLRWVGLVFAITGIIAIVFPEKTTVAAAYSFAAILVVAGMGVSMSAWFLQRTWGVVATLITGALAMVTGIAGFINPEAFVHTLSLFIIFSFSAEGIMRIIDGIRWWKYRGSGWLIATGMVSIAAGVILLAYYPVTSPIFLGCVVGANILAMGFNSMLFRSFLKDVNTFKNEVIAESQKQQAETAREVEAKKVD